MAGFTVSRHYTRPRDEVRADAEALAAELEDKYGIRARWQGDTVTLRGNGVEGRLEIDAETVQVTVTLGLLARAFERPLRRIVDEHMDRYVG
ncbi:MAG: polyhydroxyalkanoic acid system family protein [Halieaceae bacterium]|jgi:putative polyhydroxyalkanoate system protein|nr:polyhydroxyalkanoic acid system family protein [Halieaceae bacterium]